MPATALDAFFRSRPDLARPKGLAWLAKYCHAHGLRKVTDPNAAPREAGRAFHLELLVWGAHGRSARVLGEDHPLTRKIAVAFLECFDEQLEWSSLDDIPSAVLAHRAKLLGD